MLVISIFFFSYIFFFLKSFLQFKLIYFTSIQKQVLTTYTNLSRFCFLGTTPVLAPKVWANEKILKLRPAPGNQTRDLKIARPSLYLTTTDTTGRLSQYVERRNREHNISGHYRLWARIPGWPTKKLPIVFRMRR